MDLDADELAGIVDLFGVLARPALRDAVTELAFREGEPPDEETVDAAIDEAVDEFALLQFQLEGEPTLVPGPTAFPVLPEGAEDLPHILDVERREVDRSILAEPVRTRLEAAAREVADPERAADLIDVTYDAETWTDVDLADVRDRLAPVADGAGPG
ncbi:MAG: hypothetical protein ABEJ59_02000 [Halanaeroarchaeum sp.]